MKKIDIHNFDGIVQELIFATTGQSCSTLQECVAITQKEWLRAFGTERWQIKNTRNDLRAKAMPYFDALGYVQEHTPSLNTYDYAVLLGASLPFLENRLTYLIELCQKSISFKQLICLVGRRPLDEIFEIQVLRDRGVRENKLPKNEIELMQYLIATTRVKEFFEHAHVVIIDTPGTFTPYGTYVRPTTADTVKAWIAQSPSAGSVLAISNQPLCVYQHVVLTTILPTNFFIETSGPEATDDVSVALYFDTIARTLYQAYSTGHQEIHNLITKKKST